MEESYETNYKIGERVELHPATDAWMQGDRYGEVVKFSRNGVYVKLDKSNRILRFSFFNVHSI